MQKGAGTKMHKFLVGHKLSPFNYERGKGQKEKGQYESSNAKLALVCANKVQL